MNSRLFRWPSSIPTGKPWRVITDGRIGQPFILLAYRLIESLDLYIQRAETVGQTTLTSRHEHGWRRALNFFSWNWGQQFDTRTFRTFSDSIRAQRNEIRTKDSHKQINNTARVSVLYQSTTLNQKRINWMSFDVHKKRPFTGPSLPTPHFRAE